MKKNLLTIGACLLGVVAMTGCASKCTFKEFQDAVKEVKEHEFKTAKVKGTVKAYDKEDDEKEEYKLNEELTWESVSLLGVEMGAWSTDAETEEAAVAAALMMVYGDVSVVAAAEAENTTYYAGSTFKVKMEEKEEDFTGKATITWNKYGLLTSLKMTEKDNDGSYEKINITVSYKK